MRARRQTGQLEKKLIECQIFFIVKSISKTKTATKYLGENKKKNENEWTDKEFRQKSHIAQAWQRVYVNTFTYESHREEQQQDDDDDDDE